MCVYSPKLQRAGTSVAGASSPSHPHCFRSMMNIQYSGSFAFTPAGQESRLMRLLPACRILCDNQLGSDYQDENEPACDLEESSCCHLHHCHLNRMHA